ncbi:MAG TPA: DNA-formamidopyrimidine glycosylase family protein [Pyrinomonadaceae bacterium]|nr:DNA-formamidopyrimidine glycosylase family protein [Pyrinomonadaceae bacterium]
MPELPDVVVYLEALERRIAGHKLERVQLSSPFLLRTATPPVSAAEGKKVVQLRRVGKRLCIGLETDLWLVIHLMIAGRLHWKDAVIKKKPASLRPPKNQLAAFSFDNGTLSLTEAGTQRRASLNIVMGKDKLKEFDAGGMDIFEIDLDQFASVLQSENHTLKRSLTDPRMFSGIGNAYSDEILWQACLSPVAMTRKLAPAEVEKLFAATRETLTKWTDRLRSESVDRFPEKVTAFRPEMAVHGKYGEPCPRCGNKVQRIRYAANETDYCPQCQTGGKLLADRALSRLLRSDWPRTANELEEIKR